MWAVREAGLASKALVCVFLMLTIVSPLLVGFSLGNAVQQPGPVSRPLSMVMKWSYATGDELLYGPLVADIDGDGKQEILVGSDYHGVYCLSGGGWVKWVSETGNYTSLLGAADSDGDGEVEVVAVVDGSTVYWLNGTGGLKWKLPIANMSSIVMADLDGDNWSELVVSGGDQVTCLNLTGGLKWSWIPPMGIGYLSLSAIGDVNTDGRNEILVVANRSVVFCLNGTGSQLWSYEGPPDIRTSPAIADIDEDGRREIVIVSWYGVVQCLDEGGIRKWNYTTWENNWADTLVADLDGDGWKETHIGGSSVFCLNGSGQVKWRYPIYVFHPNSFQVANFDNDSELEVVMDTGTDFVSYLTGSGGIQYFFAMREIVYNDVVADVDGDGRQEVIVTSIGASIYCLGFVSRPVVPDNPTVLAVYSLLGIGVFSSLLLIVVVAVRRKRRSGSMERPSKELGQESLVLQNGTALSEAKPRPSISSLERCPSCGATMAGPNSSYCWSCRAPLESASRVDSAERERAKREPELAMCMVCNLRMNPSDKTLTCPYCGNVAHKTHMLEWLHVKNYCPRCHKHLDERACRA